MRRMSVLLLAIAAVGCDAAPKAEEAKKDETAKAEAPTEAAKPEDTKPAEAANPADEAGLSNEERLARGSEAVKAQGDGAFKVQALTPEEERLITADDNTLTAEERKKKAYALRKKILSNPDSPQAQQLKEMAGQVVTGEVAPNLDYKDGSKPKSSEMPAE